MTEVLFYHLQQQPLEALLPGLLEKSLERGWRVVVEAGSPVRCDQLDALLWTYSDDSFLPHGLWRDPEAAQHPILITPGAGNPNGANVRFLVAGASAGDLAGYARV
ncbi:MAG: DNA polymerase III subunit chi, partial [Rhizobiales bacterium]|nr:DNA polymerase III subunit chi [Hyphomicrobiales bacterium]